jgi:hypothetical protein
MGARAVCCPGKLGSMFRWSFLRAVVLFTKLMRMDYLVSSKEAGVTPPPHDIDGICQNLFNSARRRPTALGA